MSSSGWSMGTISATVDSLGSSVEVCGWASPFTPFFLLFFFFRDAAVDDDAAAASATSSSISSVVSSSVDGGVGTERRLVSLVLMFFSSGDAAVPTLADIFAARARRGGGDAGIRREGITLAERSSITHSRCNSCSLRAS